jgi:hypothetical protein
MSEGGEVLSPEQDDVTGEMNKPDTLTRFDFIRNYAKKSLSEIIYDDSLKGYQMRTRKMKEGDHKGVESLLREHVNRALNALKEELNKKAGSPQRVSPMEEK